MSSAIDRENIFSCRQGNIFPVYDRANARQPGKSLIFLAHTAN